MVDLVQELTAVRGELTRVDTKCGTLAGLTGAGLAFLTTHLDGPAPVRAVLALAGTALTAATLTLLSVLRPRLGTTGFRRWARMNPQQVDRYLTDATEHHGTEDLVVLSQIVDRKYVGLRHAVDLSVAAVVAIAVALLMTAVAS